MDTATRNPATAPRTIRLHADDDVVIARQQLVAGTEIESGVSRDGSARKVSSPVSV